jgi:hypothetical protein
MDTGTRLAIAVLALTILLATILFGLGAAKPLNLDNAEFPPAAEATAKTWTPVYYRGEDMPRRAAVFHPPLYVYTLAAWVKAFGASPASFRYFGFACLLLAGAVAVLLVQETWGSWPGWRFHLWYWPLLLLNPYTLQTASIVDIDSSIYGPVLVLLLWGALRLGRCCSGPGAGWVLLAAGVCVALWFKLTTALILWPAFWLLLRRRLGGWPALWRATLVFWGGALLFLATYAAFCRLLDLNFRFAFAFIAQSVFQRGAGSAGLADWLSRHLSQAPGVAAHLVSWGGVLPWVLLPVSTVLYGLRARRRAAPGDDPWFAILLVCLSTVAVYCLVTGVFGGAPFKYTFVFWPVVVAAAALQLSFAPFDKTAPAAKPALAGAAIFLAAAAASLAWWKDRLIVEGLAGAPALAMVAAPLLLLAAGGLMQATAGARRLGRLAVCAAALVSGGALLGTAIHQARADYSTTYDYGQGGFEDTAAFLRLHTSEDEILACMKDMGYATRRRYYETYAALYFPDPRWMNALVGHIASGRIRYAVFTERHGQDQLAVNPALERWVRDNCRLVRAIGDYRVFELARREKP